MISAPQPVIRHPNRLNEIVRTIFTAAGASHREAALAAEHLVEANLQGHDSHGIGIIPAYVDNARTGALTLNQSLSVTLDVGPLILCDGGAGLGQAMAHDAIAIGTERALATGACILGLRNSHHIGRIGHWAEQCAAAGLVSVHFVNVVSEPAVAPFGGTKARIGTNPFAVGIPRAKAPPIIVDFATSRLAVGKVRVAFNKGEPVPPGTLLDASGQATDDPAVLFSNPKGALLPFGEHKGWGLSLACELLGAALTGGKTQSGPKHSNAIINSMFSVLVSPERLGTETSFNEEINAFVAWARSEAVKATQVLLPGEPERAIKRERERDGIPIDQRTWDQVTAAANALGVTDLGP
jgi:hydroxycarboxylate dehydrogenase B